MSVKRWVLGHQLLAASMAAGVVSAMSGGTALVLTQDRPTASCQPSGVTIHTTPGPSNADTVNVSWTAPPSSCGVTDYRVVTLSPGPAGRILQVVSAADPNASQDRRSYFADVQGDLALCTKWRLGVSSVSNNGDVSAVAEPPNGDFAYTWGTPTSYKDGPPNFPITILLQGISSFLDQNANMSWDPGNASYCTSGSGKQFDEYGSDGYPNPPGPLRQAYGEWLTPTKEFTPSPGAGNNLLDSLAATGGWVLPFSYGAASVESIGYGLNFHADSYTADKVANTSPLAYGEGYLTRDLQEEIQSIHSLLPYDPIFLVGHSNGGLIAEQWWLQYGSHNPDGVAHIFSLDSPINGLAHADLCEKHLDSEPCAGFGVGATDAVAYDSLWQHLDSTSMSSASTGDGHLNAIDAQDSLYTPVGSYGDPLYDAGEFANDPGDGISSQLLFANPSCAKQGDSRSCALTAADFVSPCSPRSSPLDDLEPSPTYGIVSVIFHDSSLWMHSVVKNCPGVTAEIMSYVSPAATPDLTAPSTSTPSSTTDTANPSLCQINLGPPNSIGQLPTGGPYQTVITDSGLEASLGLPSGYLTPGTQEPNDAIPPDPGQVTSGPGTDSPGSATTCQWTGRRINPIPPLYLPVDLKILLSIVRYPSASQAGQAEAADTTLPPPPVPPQFALPKIADGASYVGPGPEDGGVSVDVQAGQYDFNVTVMADADQFSRAPWIKIALAVAESLTYQPTGASSEKS